MSSAIALTDADFKDKVAGGVTLVDFWAEWCGPCRMVTPILEDLASEYEGKAQIGKVNVDDAPGLAEQYGISSIPTLLIIKEGDEVNRFVGVTGKDVLAKALDEALA